MSRLTETTITPLTVSVAKAAEITGLSEWTIRDLVYRGRIASRRFGRRVLVEYKSLAEYIGELEEVA